MDLEEKQKNQLEGDLAFFFRLRRVGFLVKDLIGFD